MDANVSFGHEKLSGLICALRPEDTADDAGVAPPPPHHVHVYPIPSSRSCPGSGEGSGSAAGVGGGAAVWPPNVLGYNYAKVTPNPPTSLQPEVTGLPLLTLPPTTRGSMQPLPVALSPRVDVDTHKVVAK